MIEEVKDKWPLWLIVIFLIILSFNLKASHSKDFDPRVGLVEEDGIFSGRISKINEKASLIRLKVDFINFKYINKNDRVDFWSDNADKVRCRAKVVGKSNEYLLLKVPDYFHCKKYVLMAYGSYLKLFSQDLLNNLKMGKVLVGILLKKHMALSGKVRRYKDELDRYIERVGTISDRYQILRDKLEAEWKDELNNMERDRMETLVEYGKTKRELDELNSKLEKYKIGDENLTMDRWSLDPKLYFKK